MIVCLLSGILAAPKPQGFYQSLPFYNGGGDPFLQSNFNPRPPHHNSYDTVFGQSFQQPIFKPFYQSNIHNPNFLPFGNEFPLRRQQQFVPDYPSFPYPGYPQYDESYPDLDGINQLPPPIRDPIQLIPSRFPPGIENFVGGLQNRFSIYNPIFPLPAKSPVTTTTEASVTTTVSPGTTDSGESLTEPTNDSSTEDNLLAANEENGNQVEEVTTRTDAESITEKQSSEAAENKTEEAQENATETAQESVTESEQTTTAPES